MLLEILKNIRNYFPDLKNQIEGTFEIKGGAIDPFININNGQYYLIEGSALNDGVWNSTEYLQDETFEGVITPLKIPREFLSLVEEIEAYQADHKVTDYTSESFAGYSYQKATNSKGQIASWQDAFATRLNAWRKI